MLKQVFDSPYIFAFHSKSDGYQKIIGSLQQLIRTKDNETKMEEVKNKINLELKQLNYNFSYHGTKYLAETIFEIYKVKDVFDGDLKNTIYPIIAKKHHTNVSTIYGNIKEATKSMILDCEEKTIQKYFDYSYFTTPKIKEIIFTILNKID